MVMEMERKKAIRIMETGRMRDMGGWRMMRRNSSEWLYNGALHVMMMVLCDLQMMRFICSSTYIAGTVEVCGRIFLIHETWLSKHLYMQFVSFLASGYIALRSLYTFVLVQKLCQLCMVPKVDRYSLMCSLPSRLSEDTDKPACCSQNHIHLYLIVRGKRRTIPVRKHNIETTWEQCCCRCREHSFPL
jgi:hypothetical protein